ncbi:MAG: ribokinase [Methylococcaceae bacterium]
MNKAIVVGSINMDIVAFVIKHPHLGETVFAKDVKYFPGGKGANQAVSCKRLGCNTLMIGRLGDDQLGEQMMDFLQQEGIDISGVKKLKNMPTGTAFITVSENSDNSIVVMSGANSIWDETFLDDVTINEGDVVLAQFEVPDEVIQKTFCKAKNCGAITMLNPTPVRVVNKDTKELTDILIVNEHELKEISGVSINVKNGDSVFKAAEQLESDGYNSIIVTLGEKGVCVLDMGQRERMNSRSVIAVDTTGAGDTFIGGLAAGLLSGFNLTKAAELGNIAASISVTREGAASSIPTFSEVNEILSSNNEG